MFLETMNNEQRIGLPAIITYLRLYDREDSYIKPIYYILYQLRQFCFGDDSTSHLSTAQIQQLQTSQVLSVQMCAATLPERRHRRKTKHANVLS
jgi:hypothetical protein